MPEYEKKTDKERVAEITDKLESGIKDLMNGDNFKKYLSTMSKFHNYSFNNTMLIAMQKPDASLVAGYNTWKNKFERNVNRGEKGIQIFAPSPYTIKKEQTKLDEITQLPVLDKDGKPVTEEVDVKIPSFKVVSVFDVSQTNGKELPTLGADELTGDVEDFEKFFAALKEVSPVPIGFEQIDSGAKGYFSRDEQRIAINEGMSEVQTIKTAVHEIAHSKLHDRDLKKSDVEQKPKDRNTEEVEAESIAFTVCTHFGIDTSDYSFAYVATWGTDKELPELKSSLETIRATSNELINSITDIMQEKTRDKEQSKEQTAEKPDKSNIIGNTAYSAIEDKQYFRLKSETAEKVANYLTENNIPFSGRINGDKTTLTIGQKNVDDYKTAVAFVTGKEKAEPKQEQPEKVAEKLPEPEKPVNKSEIPIYQKSAAYAAKFDESDQWRNSFKLNMEVKKAIEADASMAYHEKRSKPFLQNLVSEYGVDRPLYVLARTVKMKGEYDGRFSPEVKAIAEKYDYPDMKLKYDNTQQYVTDVHSILVDEMVYRLTEMKGNLEKETQTEIEDKKLDIPMPDDTVTVADRNSFGYTWDGMLPLSTEKALELFENDQSVYLLHGDNTESLAVSVEDIEQHRGMCGIETEEWSKFCEIKAHYKELADKEPECEAQLFNESEKAVGIYQLNDNPDTRNLCFEPLKNLQDKGITPNKENYTLVYALDVSDDKSKSEGQLLEDVFEKFNMERPADFKGHSLSVSDIVVIQDKGEISSHYCDSAGFTEIAFLEKDRENLQMKRIEDVVEQNDNNFDGIINNTPSLAELEAKAKNGEVISLMDVAKAAKNEQDKPDKPTDKKTSIYDKLKAAKERQQPTKEKDTPTKKGMEI